MPTNKFIKKLLRFKDLRVCGHHFDPAGGLHLKVKHAAGRGARCPHCARRGRVVRSSTVAARTWADLPICGRKVHLHCTPKEIVCPVHGRCQEHIPWARTHARVTYRLEFTALKLCSQMPGSKAAEKLLLASSTLSDIIHRSIAAARQGHLPGPLRLVGIDEISYKKGHKYLTLVYDLETSTVVWAGEGKGRATIDRFFEQVLDAAGRARIEAVTCDMSETYIGAAEHHCPNAKVVLDRFHVVKALNRALDEVRRDAWRDASAKDRKLFKGVRWLLLKSPANRSKADTRRINLLRKANRRIHRAWCLKDQFEHFWQYIYTGSAEAFLKTWTRSALLSRMEPLRKFAKTLRKHTGRLLSFVQTGLTNATAEGLNRLARQMRNWASGYSNPESFIDMLYLRLGDLDIAAQIPEGHRVS